MDFCRSLNASEAWNNGNTVHFEMMHGKKDYCVKYTVELEKDGKVD
jgi:hypothetical protein